MRSKLTSNGPSRDSREIGSPLAKARKTRGGDGALKPSVLRDIVRRVAHAAQPDRIVLFGSAARGEMGPNSDVDLLIVKRGKYNRRRLAAKIYKELHGAEAPVDLVIVTPDEVRRYQDSPALAIFPALREGRVVYGVASEARRPPRGQIP
jgi:uncharacterized protein